MDATSFRPQSGVNIVETGLAMDSAEGAVGRLARMWAVPEPSSSTSSHTQQQGGDHAWLSGNLVISRFGNGRTYVFLSGEIAHDRLHAEAIMIESLTAMREHPTKLIDPARPVAGSYQFVNGEVVLNVLSGEALDDALATEIMQEIMTRAATPTQDAYVVSSNVGVIWGGVGDYD